MAGQFKISIPTASHNDYGLRYPVTYKFSIPAPAVNLTAWRRTTKGADWTQLLTKTTDDFFNGIEAVRFDYINDLAYISVAFDSDSDNIYLLFKDAAGDPVVGISFVEICAYYDNRQSVVTFAISDFTARDDNPNDLLAVDAARTRNIWATADIITSFSPKWTAIQNRLDLGYLEAANHSYSHPPLPYPDYDLEINTSKQNIIDNLDLPAIYKKGATEYVPVWAEPFFESNATVRAKLGQYKYLISRQGYNSDYVTFATWDAINGTYNRCGHYAVIEDNTEQVLKDRFDLRYAAGEIYYLFCHAGLNDWTPGLKALNVLDYIKDKKDVWYVGSGALYMYHYVQERSLAAVSEISPVSSNLITIIRRGIQ